MEQLEALALLGAAFAVLVLLLAWLLEAAFAQGRRVLPHDEPELVVRRCDACGRGWKADPQRRGRVMGLRVRRWVRHRARRRDEPPPGWSGPQGWARCPSCLSTRVRNSGDPWTPAPWTRLEKVGAVAAIIGGALLLGALAGAVV